MSHPAMPNPSNSIISPVASRSTPFQAMDAGAAQQSTQFLGRDTQAINAQPVEIGGMEIGVEEIKRRNTGERMAGVGGSLGGNLGIGGVDGVNGDGDAGGEINGEKRAQILASRSKDPSVIVDVPNGPTAEEVQAARSADGMVTPGLGRGGEAWSEGVSGSGRR